MPQISLNILNFAARTGFFFGRAASSRYGVPSALVARLASGYSLHHLRPRRFAARATVVPLLSLSLVAPLVRPRFAQLKNKN
jgi:hypothetical protein